MSSTCFVWCVCFFFFKQKTAYEMRISDWSSDVCSSDLDGTVTPLFAERIDPVASPALAESLRRAPEPLAAAPLIHVESSDARWTPWEVYLRKLGLARGTARSGSRDLRFTNYVQATQAALAGRGVMLGWRPITGDLVAEGRLVPVVARPLEPDDASSPAPSPPPPAT